MQFRDLERNDHGTVRVDLCFDCAGIWFDKLASVQLAPAAVIELFKEIHAHQTSSPHPVAPRLSCPRCAGSLELGYDLAKTGRFSYFRCLKGDGRFTPFMQFLREKQFVRDLTEAELQQVRSKVRQILCSECGAPIDLEHETACRYCHAPVSFLDPTAVDRAVALWSHAEERRCAAPSRESVANALQMVQHDSSQRPAALGAHFFQTQANNSMDAQLLGSSLDLVAIGIHAIGRLFEGSR
jgi:hypothetical protein